MSRLHNLDFLRAFAMMMGLVIHAPILFTMPDVARDFQIENEVDISVKLGYDNSSTEFSKNYTNNLSEFEVIAYSKSYSLQPKLTYNFSKFVEGDIWLNYSVSKTHTTGKKKETDIGFQVRIYFESFN